jgi:HD domain
MHRVMSQRGSSLLMAAALLAVATLVSLALPAGVATLPLTTLAMLFTAVTLLDVFDLLLPRGDRIGLDGPLIAAAAVAAPPVAVFALALIARAAAMTIRREHSVDDWALELSTTAGGAAAALLIVAPFATRAATPNWTDLLLVALACAALLGTQMLVSQLYSSRRMGRPFTGLLIGNLRFQGPLLGAEMSASVLLALTYEQMGSWALVLVVVLLLLLRHSYGLLISVRRTYMNTVEVLVDTAELSDARRAGHSERTAQLARDIAEELGLTSRDVERLSYAALLHDLDMVGLDPEDVETQMPPGSRQAGRVLSQVGFLSDVVPLLKILDGDPVTINSSSPEQRVLSMIIALASDIDSASKGVPVVGGGDVARVANLVSPSDKARVIGATIRLGHPVPAVP